MTHSELTKAIAKRTDLTADETAILLRELNHIMMKHLQDHGKVRIKNFGAFVVVKHKSRTVPDPREMSKKLVIFDQFLPKFRPSEQLRALVKNIKPNHKALEDDATESTNELLETPTNEPVESDTALPAAEVAQPDIDLSSNREKEAKKAEPIGIDDPEEKASTDKKVEEPIKEESAQNQEDNSEETKKSKTKTSKKTQNLDASIKALSQSVNIGYIDLSNLTIDSAVLELIPKHIAKKYQLVAVEKHDDTLVVAMIDPGDREAIDIVARQTGLQVEPKITTSGELQHALDQYATDNAELTEDVSDADSQENKAEEDPASSDAPATKAVTTVLERAVREKASDIHIEPDEKKVNVRYRIDGVLQQVMELPKNLQASVVSRLKIMSSLKIDESRLPQDGRLRIAVDHKTIDFRLSTLPTVNGEKVVMRILDESAGMVTFEQLGLDGENLRRVQDNIEKSHGMLLVTGPTGSGKTTTLYSVIGTIINPEINIITVEDPVEYRITGINQSQVNNAIDYSFASALRSIVRQDPDVILIGEIRDLETATMAIHSALTGHVVLSTLHTNDAAGAIPRLIDMGIEPFLITSSTNVILAQRLVRKICEECKVKVDFPDETIKDIKVEMEKIPSPTKETLDFNNLTFHKGKGCSRCNNSGYKGRIGIFEVLSVSEEIKQMALKRVSSSELTEQAIKEGMVTLKQDGIVKVLKGVTTLEEVWRVTKD